MLAADTFQSCSQVKQHLMSTLTAKWYSLQVDSIQSDALFVLLVEKDAAFMRLAEDRFYNTYPCIILTAKGQPDVASRQALQCLHSCWCGLPCCFDMLALPSFHFHTCLEELTQWQPSQEMPNTGEHVQAVSEKAQGYSQDTCLGTGGL